MRYLVTGDLQVRESEGLRKKVTNETVEWLCRLIQDLKPDIFVYLGDLGDNNRVLNHQVLSVISDLICGVADSLGSGTAFWLVGNHDYYSADGDVNLLKSFGRMLPKNCKLVWKFLEHDSAIYVSYIKNEEFKSIIASSKKEVLFCHQPIQNAQINLSYYEPDGVDFSILPDFTVVGHYHIPAVTEKILYAGSPINFNWSDNVVGLPLKRQLRGAWLIEEKGHKREISFCENPYTHYFAQVRSREELLSLQLPAEKLHLRVVGDIEVDTNKFASCVRVKESVLSSIEVRSPVKLDTQPNEVIKIYVAQSNTELDKSRLVSKCLAYIAS